MAKFKITPTTTVAELKEQFRNEVGGTLRIYDGRSEASDSVTLVSLGAKEGELECKTNRTVGRFEEAFQLDFNLKVKVYTKDNWVKVLYDITLATVAELPNGITKAKMEEYLSYRRKVKEEVTVISDIEETNSSNYEDFTEEQFEEAKSSDNIIVVMIKSDAKNIQELHEEVFEEETLAIVTRIGDGFHYVGDNDTEPDVFEDREINFDELYLIDGGTRKLDEFSFDNLEVGIYAPESVYSYIDGEDYPDSDNDPCFVIAEALTGDDTGHVWPGVDFYPDKIFVCDGKIIAKCG